MPERSHPTKPERAADNQPKSPSLGSRVKERFEQGMDAIVEAIGSLLPPEPTPVPASQGGARRPPRRVDHRFR